MDLIHTTADYQIMPGPIKCRKLQCQCLFENKPAAFGLKVHLHWK